MNIPIIKETSDWLVVNKPAGLSVHDENGTPGLVSLLKAQRDVDYLALIHRLDKVTSGCLLLAKNTESAAYLSKQFKDRKVEKIYIALTKGKPKKKQGTIIGDMQPARSGNYKLLKSKLDPAITQFFSFGFESGLRLAVIKILTGKTHQIRVAMKANGCPVWGDERYGNVESNEGADRCYLHHFQISFLDLKSKQIILQCLPEQAFKYNYQRLLNFIKQIKIEKLAWPNKI